MRVTQFLLKGEYFWEHLLLSVRENAISICTCFAWKDTNLWQKGRKLSLLTIVPQEAACVLLDFQTRKEFLSWTMRIRQIICERKWDVMKQVVADMQRFGHLRHDNWNLRAEFHSLFSSFKWHFPKREHFMTLTSRFMCEFLSERKSDGWSMSVKETSLNVVLPIWQ